jgi:hypothetical protein
MVLEHAELNNDAILDKDQVGTLSFSHEAKHVKHTIFLKICTRYLLHNINLK